MIKDLKRSVHQPKKFSGNPLVIKDKPWENIMHVICNTWNVIYDHEEEIFKFWYEDWHYNPKDDFSRRGSRVCYAHSQDGINWEKTLLPSGEHKRKGTNVVLGNDYGSIHAASIILDPSELNSERRFKAIYILMRENANLPKVTPWGKHTVGFCAAYSRNGVDWTPYEENPVLDYGSGDVLILTYDEQRRKYVLLTRPPNRISVATLPKRVPSGGAKPHYPGDESRAGEKRRIYLTESDDMINWPEPVLCHAPNDYEDNLDESYYGMTRTRIGDVWVGILNIFHQVDDYLDVKLVYSRDYGRSWKNIPGIINHTFLPSGPLGSWDQAMVNICSQPIKVRDELWVYYGGSMHLHDSRMLGSELGLAKLRLDGFVSMDAGEREGVLATKPFFSDGKYLIINAECESQGYVEAEFCNAETDEAVKGYSRDDCDTFKGDSINHKFSWKTEDEVNIIPGWTRLRFYLCKAKMYSFRVSDEYPPSPLILSLALSPYIQRALIKIIIRV